MLDLSPGVALTDRERVPPPGAFHALLGRLRGTYAVGGAGGTAAAVRRVVIRRWHDSFARVPEGDGSRVGEWIRSSAVILARNELPQCYHYRVEQKLELLREIGVPVLVADPRNVRASMSALQSAAVLIVYRLAWDRNLSKLIGEARRLSIPVVFESDDAVFDVSLLRTNPNVEELPRSLRWRLARGVRGYARALSEAEYAVASTESLRLCMARQVPGSAFIVENGIDAQMRRFEREPVLHQERVRIGYGSGSMAHDADLGLVAQMLARVLERFPQVELVLIGPVRTPGPLREFDARIEIHPLLPYPQYLELLQSIDISIAPLVPAPFNQYKSHVKYLEASLTGSAFVGSPTVYDRYVDDGHTGLLARGDEWFDALRQLVEWPERRMKIALEAHRDVRRWHLDQRPRTQTIDMLRSLAPGLVP